MNIHIIDANNWVRKVHEKDVSGLALRNQFTDAFYNTDIMIYVFDGENAKEARRKIFPGYKAKRLPGSDEFYISLNLFKLLVECTNKTMICIPGWEADDVIATLVRTTDFGGIPTIIRSTDADFLALCGNGVSVSEPSIKLKDIPAEHIRLYKTLCGDTSDNISGLPTFGPKSFEGMIEKNAHHNWYLLLDARNMKGFQAADLHITNSQHLWLEQNLALILAFWDIINFIPVPDDLMKQHTIVGKPNMAAGNAILKTIFQ